MGRGRRHISRHLGFERQGLDVRGGAHKRKKGSQGICWRTAAFATVKGGAEDKPARAGGPSEGTARVPREQGCLLVVWSPSTSSLTPLRLSNVCGTNEPVCLPVKPGPLWPTLVVRSLSVSCRLLQMAQSKENAGSAGPGAVSGPASLGAPSPSRGASRCPTMPLCLGLASSISLRPWPRLPGYDSLICSSVQHSVKHLLCARHSSGCW